MVEKRRRETVTKCFAFQANTTIKAVGVYSGTQPGLFQSKGGFPKRDHTINVKQLEFVEIPRSSESDFFRVSGNNFAD